MTELEDQRPCVGVGEIIDGKYRVECVIGVGGMAFVVAAKHLALEERFALKFLAAPFAKRPDFVERFTREAKAACRLRSEYVARVHDVGMHRGTPFLVMEHLTGRDLASVLSETGTLAIDEAVEYAIQACEALATAHASGIVHRDIKPENLFRVEEDGIPHVKLLDFGISKIGLAGDALSRLTGNLSMGTPSYMAPEQIRSTAAADERSDQWSLGVVLYELLAGAPPFMAPTVNELCAAVLEEHPARLDEIHPVIPAELANVVARCMEKDPTRRFLDVAELAEALLPFAPPRAVACAERARRVLSGVSSPLSRITPPAMSVSPPVSVRTPSTGLRKRPRGIGVFPILGLMMAAAGAIAAYAGRDALEAQLQPTTISTVAATPVPTETSTAIEVESFRSAAATPVARQTTPTPTPTPTTTPTPPKPTTTVPSAIAAVPHVTTSLPAKSADTPRVVATASATTTSHNGQPVVELGY
jgi:eukaryotic-like serine/threonine-protein kinase